MPGRPFFFPSGSPASTSANYGPMSFNKFFFKNIGDLLQDYYKVYPCGAVTLTLRVGDHEYNVAKILKCDDDLLTFAYYSAEKSHALPTESKEKSRDSIAWPALTIPYGFILWVEFNPRKAATEREIGFTAEDLLPSSS